MYEIIISEIQIFPIKPQNGLVAFASCVLNNQFFIGNIAIYTRLDGSGYRLVFPGKVLPNGKFIQNFYPISNEAGNHLLTAIIKKMENLNICKGNENIRKMPDLS